MVSGSISLPLSGFFSPFPHGTGSLSLTREYLAFRDGPRSFRQDSSCPDVLRVCLALLHDFGYGSFTLFAAPSPALLLSCRIDFLGSPITPSSDGLGSSAFARHYLRNRFYFLLLQVLRCFSSLRIASLARCHPRGWRVPPFGYRRVVACLLLAVAFRRLLRPSSPPGV